mmetsp:Transcript_58180/g.161147  ORF Transcript_58180/g.161147 Transcript_58180/m.161147 type:complete len:290 (-) Transcript_58180:115-984(-)
MSGSPLGQLKTDDPKKAKHRITLVWLACIVLYVGAVIAGWAVAAGGNGAASGGLGFAACFSIAVTGIVGCFGTTVMRKYPTPPAMGIFLGVVSVLSMQYLILSAIFAGQAENASQDDDESEYSNDVAFSMFSCFLFIIFLFFSTLVWTYKDHLITVGALLIRAGPVGRAFGMRKAQTSADKRGQIQIITHRGTRQRTWQALCRVHAAHHPPPNTHHPPPTIRHPPPATHDATPQNPDPLAPGEVYEAPTSAAEPVVEGNATGFTPPTPAEAGAGGAVTQYAGASQGVSM